MASDFEHHMHHTLSKWFHICVDPPPYICAQPWKRRPRGAAAFISNHKRNQRAIIASAQPFHGQNQKQRRSCVSVNDHSHRLDPCEKRVLEASIQIAPSCYDCFYTSVFPFHAPMSQNKYVQRHTDFRQFY